MRVCLNRSPAISCRDRVGAAVWIWFSQFIADSARNPCDGAVWLVQCGGFGVRCLPEGVEAMDKNTLRVFGLASQLGFSLAGPLLVFMGGGVLLDRRLHTTPLFILIGAVVGFVVAGVALYDIVKRLPASRPSRRAPPDRPSGPNTR